MKRAASWMHVAVVLAILSAGAAGVVHGQEAPAPDGAEEAKATFGRLGTDQELWSGPGTAFRVVATAAAGTLLEIIGETGDYFRVRVPQGFNCYIHSDYIAVDAGQRGRVTGDAVNLRSIPSTSGDYPLCKVNNGETLLVWRRHGEWVEVSAPEDAHLYVIKTAVAAVPETPEILQERAGAREKGRLAWEEHVRSISAEQAEARTEETRGAEFGALEILAEQGFAGHDLARVKSDYETIAAETADPVTKKIAAARVREIDALIASRTMEQTLDRQQADMQEREEEWRRERQRLQAEAQTAAAEAAATPATLLPAGRLLIVLGRVDASGETIVLRGGRTQESPLYTIVCPDERFVLADFDGRRIAIRGRVSKMIAGELPEVAVERIEILH